MIGPIKDKIVCIATKLLSCKILHKMRPNQCSATTMDLVDLCTLVGVFNWLRYLLNELIDDVTHAQHKDAYKFLYSSLLILISFTVWGNLLDYVQMEVPLLFLGAKYQNLWEDKVETSQQKDNKIVFFLHVEVLHDVVHRSHRIHAATVHRYIEFINFQAKAHNIILLPTKNPIKQVHHADFMVTNEDMDAIINLWLEEWCSPLANPVSKEKDAEEPLLYQVHSEEHEGNDNQDD